MKCCCFNPNLYSFYSHNVEAIYTKIKNLLGVYFMVCREPNGVSLGCVVLVAGNGFYGVAVTARYQNTLHIHYSLIAGE